LGDGPRSGSDIVAATRLFQSNASAHLACLADCGRVSCERCGKFVYSAIADKRVAKVLEEAEGMLEEIGAHVDRCPRYEARPRRSGTSRVRRRRDGSAG